MARLWWILLFWQEEAALKMEQEKERRKRAEEKFKEWLAKANEKDRAGAKSPHYPTSRSLQSAGNY